MVWSSQQGFTPTGAHNITGLGMLSVRAKCGYAGHKRIYAAHTACKTVAYTALNSPRVR